MKASIPGGVAPRNQDHDLSRRAFGALLAARARNRLSVKELSARGP